jgi:predicted S18 family serine protease
MTTLEDINDLYEISEYMQDKELGMALEFIAKTIMKPEIPMDVVTSELVRLQAIAAKMAMRATWMANVDKSDRAKKNLYYTAAEQINLFCQTLKYYIK